MGLLPSLVMIVIGIFNIELSWKPLAIVSGIFSSQVRVHTLDSLGVLPEKIAVVGGTFAFVASIPSNALKSAVQVVFIFL